MTVLATEMSKNCTKCISASRISTGNGLENMSVKTGLCIKEGKWSVSGTVGVGRTRGLVASARRRIRGMMLRSIRGRGLGGSVRMRMK